MFDGEYLTEGGYTIVNAVLVVNEILFSSIESGSYNVCVINARSEAVALNVLIQ